MYIESRQPIFRSISPKEAEAFLAINTFPGQRGYRPLKGKLYAENMDTGTHRRVEIAVVRVKETNSDYLMNGQHNCHAIIMHGKPYPAVISYYACEAMEDAWRLFTTFDVHATRTERQFMHSRRGLFTDERLHTVPLHVLQSCGTALFAITSSDPKSTGPQFQNNAGTKTIKADLVERFSDDVLFVNQFSECDHLMRIGAVAAIIATLRKNKIAALEFWTRVESGEMLTIGDHRRKLRDALISKKYLKHTRGGCQGQVATYTTCIVWWNAWRRGESRHAVKLNSMGRIPKVEE